jgi:hypothetical protein
MVEQLIRNQQVSGSTPLAGSIGNKGFFGIGQKILMIGTNYHTNQPP